MGLMFLLIPNDAAVNIPITHIMAFLLVTQVFAQLANHMTMREMNRENARERRELNDIAAKLLSAATNIDASVRSKSLPPSKDVS